MKLDNKSKNISTNVDTSVFSDNILHKRQDVNNDCLATNRRFDLYDFPNLHACSKNNDKKVYKPGHLIADLQRFFKYMPQDELNRLVNVISWLLAESLKNYGYVFLPNFGKFRTYNRTFPVYFNVGTGEKYAKPQFKLGRKIEFQPASFLQALVTPRSMRYMSTTGTHDSQRLFPPLFDSFVHEKRHRRRGQLYMQDAYDTMFREIPYSDEYYRALAVKEIKDESLYI